MRDTLPQPNGDPELPSWPIFEQSGIPIALFDEERRFVAVNDAFVRFYGYPREQLLGSRGEGMLLDDAGARERWQSLLRTGELYGESPVVHANGTSLQVSFAAHTSTVDGRRLVVGVLLSARAPDGAELFGTPAVDDAAKQDSEQGSVLTAREREVVRLVALGANTRAIAADLELSPETIRSHVRNAMVKTSSHTRAQLVARVLSERLAD